MVDRKRLEQNDQARQWRDTMGSKFLRAKFDAPIWKFLNSTAPAAYLRGANGGGKSYAVAWLITATVLGRYPSDYTGFKPKPRNDAYAVTVIVMSQSAQVLRDAMQLHLLGDVSGGMVGTGMIPKDSIVKIEMSRGIAGSVDFAVIKRDDGSLAQLYFRSYEQGRVSIQGIRANGGIYADEMFDDDELLGEILGRFAGVGGIFRMSATERFQQTAVAQWFYENSTQRPIFSFSMDDIKRIPAAEKRAFLENLPEAERATRYYGQRYVGGGNVWTVPIDDILCDVPPTLHEVDTRYLISIDPSHFGQSEQSSHFAALFWALPTRHNNTAYLFDEVLMRGSINDQAAALLAHGARGIPIAWPHDMHQGQADGGTIVKLFKAFTGLRFLPYHATFGPGKDGGYNRESGIELANQLMRNGSIKVSHTLTEFRSQFARYERDQKGLPIARRDDLMSAFRIGAMMLRAAKPIEENFPINRMTVRKPTYARLDRDAAQKYFGIDA